MSGWMMDSRLHVHHFRQTSLLCRNEILFSDYRICPVSWFHIIQFKSLTLHTNWWMFAMYFCCTPNTSAGSIVYSRNIPSSRLKDIWLAKLVAHGCNQKMHPRQLASFLIKPSLHVPLIQIVQTEWEAHHAFDYPKLWWSSRLYFFGSSCIA